MKTRQSMVLALLCAGCATTLTKEAAQVAVYEADASAPEESRRLPEGCRLLETTKPVDQMESERYASSDPYRLERNEAAARGGNVLLVLSDRIVNRPNLDCSASDRSPDCLRGGQTWYQVSFASYECSAEALQTLASLSPGPAAGRSGGLFSWSLGSARRTTAQVKSEILALMQQGVGTDLIVSYVRGQKLTTKLTAAEIIDWKKSGIAEAVIQAAVSP
ncbi:MAG: hypothetical protein ACRD1P_11110 [Thermoanaerobaculia bacterium]